ncbi:class I SAM-dependent rRNA methyltransferase [Rhizobium sp. GN54]|uniref:class I SAM-dependent rRNA methyltransferase n=1 Tax=Rhizobium sp. GN54 TaxID=2898150 RepID=UPI001E617A8E|nr:class I SAM-dependent rRNA methyltransferase [Rhizobium sp. GN54]MCD2183637.1 class I SAM-dependent rRNA methyltransferase [Rhizobium sp. GN54]
MKDRNRRQKNGPAATGAARAGDRVRPAAKAAAKPDAKGGPKHPGAAARSPAKPRSVAADTVRTRPQKVAEQPSEPQRPVRVHAGEKPAERVPVILETAGTDDYRLIDSGAGEKLEQYGPYRIVRPEAQALWPRSLPAHVWDRADAVFTGDTDEDGMGRWRFPGAALGETWPMRLLDTDFYGRFTAFRHVGVFPEQLAHWSWMKARIEASGRPLKVLNLFGYTGVASLVAAGAGAEVTHVDASKKAIGWARENQALGRGEKLPIRWICEDAMKFILREERRGSRYDIILADPPKFGRGPNGEVWQLFEGLPLMLDICREILSPKDAALVLTAYSIRASFYSIHELVRETMRGRGGLVESGELVIREGGLDGSVPGRALSTSLFSRWTS